MKQINLNHRDYADIYQFALKAWNTNSTGSRPDHFLAMCIIEGFLTYANANGLVVKDGKVYKDSEKERHNS